MAEAGVITIEGAAMRQYFKFATSWNSSIF